MARQIILQPPFAQHLDQELAPATVAKNDESLDDFIRRTVGTMFHPVRACSIGTSAMSVVDLATLRMHGVFNFWVVDTSESVMPTVASEYTLAAPLCLAKKAVDLVGGATRHDK